MIQLINPCGGTGFFRKCNWKKWLFSAEYLGDDSTSIWGFLFDHVYMQVLSHIKQKKTMWKCCHKDTSDHKIPPKNDHPL